jgi:6-phosphogluconolactonase (cycloisomerase 2 family)
VQLDPAHHLLFAVNTETASANTGAGPYNSDCNQGTITSFLVSSNGTLTFADRVPSGGMFPNSLTIRPSASDDDEQGNDNGSKGELLYVLNAGGAGACNVSPNVSGFQVDASGHMRPVTAAQDVNAGLPVGTGENCSAASAAGLSGFTGAPAGDFACGLNPPSFPRSPAHVKFTPDGKQLVVTVKGTNSIYVFPVDPDGRAGSPTVTTASLPALPTYFGVAFDRNAHLLVAEVFGAATNIPAGGAGALSSFTLTSAGSVQSISSHVGDGGTAACWIALEPKNGKYAYVSNNLSDNISSYSIASNGAVTLVSGTAGSGSGPNDLAAVQDSGGSFLYVLNGNSGTVGTFQINVNNGALTALAGGSGLPTAGAEGLTAY